MRHRFPDRGFFAPARKALLLLALVAALVPAATPALAGGDWNDAGIAWQDYEAGLAQAKAENKPVLLVFYTEWCPHCTRYSGVFHDTTVVEKSKDFVMIRVERDANKEISSRHAPDGEYIPRTFFLASDGSLRDIHEDRSSYLYFFDTNGPGSLLRAMNEAVQQPEAPAPVEGEAAAG